MRVGPGSPGATPPVRFPDKAEGTTRTFKTVLEGKPPPAVTAPPAAQPAAQSAAPSTWLVRRTLERAVSAERNIDTLLAAAARGKTFSPAELLALQAAVFRYSQTVEVISRVADRLVGAVKQVMGTQV
jgi:hypothetical protein